MRNLLNIVSIALWYLVNLIAMVTNGGLDCRTDLGSKKT